MRKLSLLLALLVLFTATAFAHGGDEHGAPTKLLKKIFPKAQKFVSKPLKLEGAMLKAVEAQLGKKLEGHDLTSPAFVAMVKGKSVGVAWATDAHLAGGTADIVVGVDLTGQVVGVALDHSPVVSLAQPSYLKQYIGKTADSKFKVGTDVQAAPKQNGPSQTLADSIRRAVVVMNKALIKK